MGSAWGMLVGFLTRMLICGGAPMVTMGLAGVAGGGGDGILGGYCHSDGEDEGGNLHLDLVEYARCKTVGDQAA